MCFRSAPGFMLFAYLAGQLCPCTCAQYRCTCTYPLFLSCLWFDGHSNLRLLAASGMRSNIQKLRKLVIPFCRWTGIVLKVKKKGKYLICWWVILNWKLMLLSTRWFFYKSLSRAGCFHAAPKLELLPPPHLWPHIHSLCISIIWTIFTLSITHVDIHSLFLPWKTCPMYLLKRGDRLCWPCPFTHVYMGIYI